ncbi:hypothetical protein ACHAWF_016674, partial [Thalassiosira exigua]
GESSVGGDQASRGLSTDPVQPSTDPVQPSTDPVHPSGLSPEPTHVAGADQVSALSSSSALGEGAYPPFFPEYPPFLLPLGEGESSSSGAAQASSVQGSEGADQSASLLAAAWGRVVVFRCHPAVSSVPVVVGGVDHAAGPSVVVFGAGGRISALLAGVAALLAAVASLLAAAWRGGVVVGCRPSVVGAARGEERGKGSRPSPDPVPVAVAGGAAAGAALLAGIAALLGAAGRGGGAPPFFEPEGELLGEEPHHPGLPHPPCHDEPPPPPCQDGLLQEPHQGPEQSSSSSELEGEYPPFLPEYPPFLLPLGEGESSSSAGHPYPPCQDGLPHGPSHEEPLCGFPHAGPQPCPPHQGPEQSSSSSELEGPEYPPFLPEYPPFFDPEGEGESSSSSGAAQAETGPDQSSADARPAASRARRRARVDFMARVLCLTFQSTMPTLRRL